MSESSPRAPFISRVSLDPGETLDTSRFPDNLPFLPNLNLRFDTPVTFFVGENGSGKSSLLEALAVLAGLPAGGGGTNELAAGHGVEGGNTLASLVRVAFKQRPKDGYFFRAELQAHFASLLDQRRDDPDFEGNPYKRYGGRSLHTLSHGEAFLAMMQNRFSEDLFLLDEPESALSPQRQLALLAIISDWTRHGRAQFIIATHSPILLTFPGATIVSFDEPSLPRITLQDTSHYQITHGILTSPESYWQHLRDPGD